MATSNADLSNFNRKHRKAFLKSHVHKRLLVRLAIAGTIICVLLALAVYFIEYNRLGRLVSARASVVVGRFNLEIQPFLDGPIEAKKTVIQNKLKMLLIAGKLNLGLGSLIVAGIYDLNGNEIMVERDTSSTYLNAVDAFMQSGESRRPGASTRTHQFVRINDRPHILLTYPLTDRRSERIATIIGIYALSAAAHDEVKGRITRSAFEAIGIVVLTTLILYPIIMTLIGQLSQLAANLLRSNIEILQVLGSAIAKRDSDTDIHNYRVTIYSVSLAEAFGLDRNLIRGLIKGAFLHDVGKIGISDRILLRPGKLTEKECEIMQAHVNHGIDIVKRSDWLKDAKDVVSYHHERFDGDGYPYGLNGASIPINARIFTIADVFDALTSKRPYKSPMTYEAAMKILQDGRGSLFDPELLDVFERISKSLYDQFSNRSEPVLQEKLASITQQYFSN